MFRPRYRPVQGDVRTSKAGRQALRLAIEDSTPTVELLEDRRLMTAVYWTGGSGRWDTTSHDWHVGTPTGALVAWSNAAGYDAVFDSSDATVNVASNINVHSIQFVGTGDTLSGSHKLVMTAGRQKSIVPTGTVQLNAGASATILNQITGNGGLTVVGSGSLRLEAAAGYAGSTTVNGGTVYFDANQLTTAKTTTARPLTVNSGTVVIDAPNALISATKQSPAVTINVGGTLSTGTGVSAQLRTLTLNGGTLASRANGSWDFDTGHVSVTANSDVTANALLGASTWAVSPGVTATVSGTFGGAASLVSTVTKTGNGILLLIGNDAPSSGTPSFSVAAGTLQIGNGNSAGTIPTTTLVNASLVTFDEPTSFVYDGTITGAGAVHVAGGSILFDSPSTYTGGTTVTGGTLTLNCASGSAVGSGAVAVNSGGRLNGYGHVTGSIAVGSGGTVATDSVLASGPLSLTSGATLEVDAGTTGGRFTVTGAAVLGNATLVVNGAPTATSGTGYDLISATAGISGTFSDAQQGTTVNFGHLNAVATYGATSVHLAAATAHVVPDPVPPVPTPPVLFNCSVAIAWADSTTLSVTVSSSSQTVPSGSVSLLDGTVILTTSILSGATATFSTSGLGVGTHTLAVSYSGDTTHAASLSGKVVRTIPRVMPTPVAVTLTATAVTGTEIDLVWTCSSIDPSGLTIFRSTASGSGSLITTVSGRTTTFKDTGLIQGVSYTYQIVPVGQTAGSNAASATTLLPLPSYVGPSVEPAYPSGFTTFNAPVSSTSTAGRGSPQIDEYTRTANADDSLSITAESLTNSTLAGGAANGNGAGFVAYGQTTGANGVLTDAPIQTLSGQSASVTLPSSLPSGSLYLVWARNTDSTGAIHYSSPIVINQPNIWWVESSNSCAGGVVTIYGRNLSQNPAGGASHDNSWVYLVNNASGTGQWIAVSNGADSSPEVNPYRVDFTLPASLAVGSYSLWVNNGLAGSYSWSNSTQLTVGPSASAGPVLRLPAGATEQTLTLVISQAQFLSNLLGGHQEADVILSSGSITLTSPLTIPNYIHVIGSGNSVLTVPAGSGWEYAVDLEPSNTALVGTSIVADNGAIAIHPVNGDGRESGVVELEGGQQVLSGDTISDVNPNAASAPDVNGSYTNGDLQITGSTFIGPGITLATVNDAVISGCTFVGAGAGDAAVVIVNSYNFTFSDSTVQNLSNDPSLSYSSAARVLWISTSGENIYVGNVTSVGLFPEAAISSGLNGGEQILTEASETFGELHPAAAANNAGVATISFPAGSVSPGVGWTITVGSGPGLGQTRIVTAVNFSGNSVVLTLDEPWNVAPTTASVISVGTSIDKFAIYGNTLSGDGIQSFRGNTAGVQVGGNNIAIADNTITGVVTGIGLWTDDKYQGENAAPSDFDLIANNAISNVSYGLRSITESNSLSENIALQTGDVWRSNSVSLVHLTAVSGDLPTAISFSEWVVGPAGQVIGNVIEHNTVTAPIGVTFTPGGNQAAAANGAIVATLVRGNTFTSDGSAGSNGILSTVTESGFATLVGNTFNGFAQPMNAPLAVSAAAVIVPNRSLTMTIAPGSTATTTLVIESATQSTAAWTIDTSALPSWVSLSAIQGTTNASTGLSTVAITVNASTVPAGTYELRIPVLIGGVDAVDLIIALDVVA